MRSGRLRTPKILIQKRSKHTRDENGNIDSVPKWSDVCSVFCNFKPILSKEVIVSDSSQTQVVATCQIRYRDDIDSDMRAIYRNKVYKIVGDPIPDNRSGIEHLTLNLSAGIEQ